MEFQSNNYLVCATNYLTKLQHTVYQILILYIFKINLTPQQVLFIFRNKT